MSTLREIARRPLHGFIWATTLLLLTLDVANPEVHRISGSSAGPTRCCRGERVASLLLAAEQGRPRAPATCAGLVHVRGGGDEACANEGAGAEGGGGEEAEWVEQRLGALDTTPFDAQYHPERMMPMDPALNGKRRRRFEHGSSPAAHAAPLLRPGAPGRAPPSPRQQRHPCARSPGGGWPCDAEPRAPRQDDDGLRLGRRV